MKRFTPACLAAASALASVVVADAPRPRYGGTLRMETAAALPHVSPMSAAPGAPDRAARDPIRALVFETLVTPGTSGALRPVLAVAWERDARAARWRFTLRPRVKLHDGSTLTSQQVAAALTGQANPWSVTAESDAITIDTERPMPELLWELGHVRHAIVVPRETGSIGTGPFAADRIAPPRTLSLRAHQDHWAGRPFVDGVRIETGRALGDQLTDLELGRADIVSASPQSGARIAGRGLHTAASQPLELVALVVQPNRAGPADEPVRHALALAIDRRAIADVLLQRLGEPAVTALPSWLTGYAALFPPAFDRAAARSLAAGVPARRRQLTLRFDPSDALIRSIAERLVADAGEAGLVLTLDPAQASSLRPLDLRFVRVAFDTMLHDRAAAMLMAAVQPQVRRFLPLAPDAGASLEAVLRFERSLLDQHIVIPVVHVPEVYGIGTRVESWSGQFVLPSFALDLANVWVRSGAP